MPKKTKADAFQNQALLAATQKYQASVDQDVLEVQAIVWESLKDGQGITEETLEKLARVFRGYEYIKPIADEAWDRYVNHCERLGYDIKY